VVLGPLVVELRGALAAQAAQFEAFRWGRRYQLASWLSLCAAGLLLLDLLLRSHQRVQLQGAPERQGVLCMPVDPASLLPQQATMHVVTLPCM
jgi:hypothetical protein